MTLDEAFNPLPSWTLLTSHGLVLLYIATNPSATIRQIAATLEITERRVADIVKDLSDTGFLEVTRMGRRNHYDLNPTSRFRHPFVSDVPFGQFVGLWRHAQDHPETLDRLT